MKGVAISAVNVPFSLPGLMTHKATGSVFIVFGRNAKNASGMCVSTITPKLPSCDHKEGMPTVLAWDDLEPFNGTVTLEN